VIQGKQLVKGLVAIAISTALTGCGGGDDKKNQFPEATVLTATNVEERSSGTFSISASDSDGSINTIVWQQTAGPSIEFQSSQESINFIAPEVEQDTEISFLVKVVDNDGAQTSITLSSNIIEVNLLPVIESNNDSLVSERAESILSVSVSDSDGEIVSIDWEQVTGPDISFTTQMNQIDFIAPEVTEDTVVAFKVKATDDDGAISFYDLESKIINVNRMPTLENSEVEIEFNTLTEIAFTGVDLDGDSLTYHIDSQPVNGQLVRVENSVNQFSYTPDLNSILDDKITVTVSDGELSATADIKISIKDTTAPIAIATTPNISTQRVVLSAPILVEFDDVMAIESLHNKSTDCTGSIQLSMDDFNTCAKITEVVQQDQTNQFEIQLAQTLRADKTYQLKITENVENFYGTPFENKVITSFATESVDLKITEVSSSYYYSDNRWIEIYNGTASSVNLSDYALRSASINLDDYGIVNEAIFTLSEKTLESGEYIILQGRFGSGYWQSSVAQSEQLMLVGNVTDNIRPAWWTDGYVELVDKTGSNSIDFVRWGSSEQLPLTENAWVSNDGAEQLQEELGKSLVRDINHTDNDTSTDWRYSQFMTPSGLNDVNCIEDEDKDNIPDCAEQQGTTFAGLPLYEWGARVGVQDIFIELDYMQSDDPGIKPQREALDKVIAAFAEKDIAVHFDVGDLYHNAEGISAADHDLGGGNQIDFYLQTLFVSSETAPSILDHKVNNFDMKRRPIFHYMLMANSQQEDGSGGSSGYAEIYGNDAIITLGSWGLSLETEEQKNATINFQASTIMHEFGHNLGLRHGGDENTNNKPNHLSIMNYLYQLNGLPSIGDREGDRYYKNAFRDNSNCNLPDNELVNGFTAAPENFVMSYSQGLNSDLNENELDESLGLGNVNSLSVDFNCDTNMADIHNNLDINLDGSDTDILRDVNEWNLIDLQFSNYWSGNVSGISQKPQINKLKTQDVISNDRQTLIKEQAPSAHFFQSLKSLNSND